MEWLQLWGYPINASQKFDSRLGFKTLQVLDGLLSAGFTNIFNLKEEKDPCSIKYLLQQSLQG